MVCQVNSIGKFALQWTLSTHRIDNIDKYKILTYQFNE